MNKPVSRTQIQREVLEGLRGRVVAGMNTIEREWTDSKEIELYNSGLKFVLSIIDSQFKEIEKSK